MPADAAMPEGWHADQLTELEEAQAQFRADLADALRRDGKDDAADFVEELHPLWLAQIRAAAEWGDAAPAAANRSPDAQARHELLNCGICGFDLRDPIDVLITTDTVDALMTEIRAFLDGGPR